jgi:Outer membrane lipoprotein-sorting protein
MKKHFVFSRIETLAPLALAMLYLVALSVAATSQTAEAVLAATDQVRNPSKPFRVTLALNEYINGKARDRVGLVLYAKLDEQTKQFNNLVRYAEPRRDAGKMVLLKGTGLWFYDPASKASIRISPPQRLIGQAAEGDVLSVNLGRDYTPKIVGEETLEDADRKDRDCWHLDLVAATPDAIYNHIRQLKIREDSPRGALKHRLAGRADAILYRTAGGAPQG